MINVLEATKSAFLNGKPKTLTITFPDMSLTLTNSDIVSESMVFTQILETESVLSFTGCNANKFEIELADFERDVRGERISVSIQAGNTDSITIFEGIVDEQNNLNHEDITVKIVAYDKLYTIGDTDVTEWYANLIFPMTVKQFRDSFFNHINIPQELSTLPCDDLQMLRMTSADVQINARTVMKSICQANARFGLLRQGTFSYIKLNTNVTTDLSKSHYLNVDYDPYMMEPITKVSVTDDSGTTEESYGSGDNVLKIEGNMVAYAVDREACAYRIYNEVVGLTMNSARLDLVGLPYMEVGDYVELSTEKNDIGMFILSRTLKGIQGLFDNYTSTIDQYMHEVESLSTELIKQNGRINHFYRDLEQTKSTVADNKTDADGKFTQQQTQITQNANSISAEVTRAEGVETALSNRITATEDSFTLQIEEIHREIDGDVNVYYREGVPTLFNYPAWDFTYNIPCNNTVQTTDSLKFLYPDEYYDKNIRSLTIDTDTTVTYRFLEEDGTYFWREVADTDFSIAMQKISELEVTTDSISQTVSSTVTELHSDYYTKNETEGKISVSAEAILSEVSSNYTTTSDLEANYTAKSTFEQTAESLQLQIDAIEIVQNEEVTQYDKYDGAPTLLNYPAWDFTYNIPCDGTVQTTNDLHFVYNNNYYMRNYRSVVWDYKFKHAYRFEHDDNNQWNWYLIDDTEYGTMLRRTAEVKVTTEEIKLDLTENYESKLDAERDYTKKSVFNQTINQISTEVSSKASHSEVSSAITQSADSIMTSVSATYESKTHASNTYETQSNAMAYYDSLSSSITQTATSIESEVEASGYVWETTNTIYSVFYSDVASYHPDNMVANKYYLNQMLGILWIKIGSNYSSSQLNLLSKSASSRITQQAAEISAKVSETGHNIYNTFSWSLTASAFELKSGGSTVFKCNSSGIEINGSGTFSGTITASDGTIGGWNIDSDKLSSTNGRVTISDDGDIECKISNQTKWKLDSDGTITANAGHIGGWEISNGSLRAGQGLGWVEFSSIGDLSCTVNGETMWSLSHSGNLYLAGYLTQAAAAETYTSQESASEAYNQIYGSINAVDGKFSNLNASNIKSGTLASRFLSSDVITTGTLNADMINGALTNTDKIVVNGRNYTPRTFSYAGNNWYILAADRPY